MTSTVLVAGARTPMGRFNGSLASLPATELGGVAIRGAVERSTLDATQIDYVIMGQVLQAGCGQIPARQAAVAAGIAMDVPAVTVNKVCLSGLHAIALADQLIRCGEFTTVVAGGMESMTRAPHLLPPGTRSGLPYGDFTVHDHLAYDGLHDIFTDLAMGVLTEQTNDLAPFSRLDQDRYAAQSHQRAAAAAAAGLFKQEIEPVIVRGRRADTVIDADEGIRPETTAEGLAKLRPAFRPDGTITAGSASQISDGAAAIVVMSRDAAEAQGIDWLAEVTAHGMVAGPDSSLQDKPARAIRAACRKVGIDPAELDLVEINEAFSAVALSSMRDLGVDESVVNVNGGAIALGHPIGMSGARIALHLALELRRRGGGVGAAALCGGGGQGDALLVTVPKAG